MATLKEMLSIAGTIENAEAMAKSLISGEGGERFLLDLEFLYGLQGKIPESFEVCEKACEVFPNNDRVLYNRGWHQMLQGDLLGGFILMNRGRNVGLWGNEHIGSQMPIWNGENLDGKYVLFNCEAGFGDEITFVRFAMDMAKLGAKVTVACSSGLVSLFSRIKEFSSIIRSEAVLGVYHNYWIPSMLAPVILRTQFEDLSGKPYIIPDQKYVDKFNKIIRSDKLKVGIRWLGRDGEDYKNRVFDRELMFNSVSQDHVQLYSLQKDHSYDKLPKHIIDLEILLDTWEDTAGAIANLDLVISSCTSVAHLAAAMGKPTWVIVPIMMYYIWTYPGEKSPWYDSVTLFRQEKYGEWEQPFNKIKERLKRLK